MTNVAAPTSPACMPDYITYEARGDFDGNGLQDDLVLNTKTNTLAVQYHHAAGQGANGGNLSWKVIPHAKEYKHSAVNNEAYMEFVGDLSGKDPKAQDRVTLYITDWPNVDWVLWEVTRSPGK